MKSKKALALSVILSLALALLISIFSEVSTPPETVRVSRVIDGDTLVLESGETIRLLNVNTPEKSDYGYAEARDFLLAFENKTISIETAGLDRYGRTLARVYYPNYLNLELVEKGYAKKFLVVESEQSLFNNAENEAVKNSLGIWKQAEEFSCFSFEIFPSEEKITIKNSCNKLTLKGWQIQDESRKKYKFGSVEIGTINLYSKEGVDTKSDIFWNLKTDVWNNDRDTVYLFNEKGEIAAHESYGY